MIAHIVPFAGRVGCLLTCLLGLTAAPGAAIGQAVNPQDDSFTWSENGNLPTWVVPVLKLVSSTHVEPTTGVVLSKDGLVLVPDSFASPGDEIIVLDGGTDILRNGRPARPERSFPAIGLEVLRVQGLKRDGAPFAADALEEGSEVQLSAFPPAEMIAQGEPPVKMTAQVVVLPETGQPSLPVGTALPTVTGPLIDSCGNLAAFGVADGIQTMEPSPSTLYRWRSTLLRLLRQMQITPTDSACTATIAPAEPEPEPTPDPVVEEAAPEPEPVQPEPEPESPEPVAEESIPEDEAEEEVAGPELPDIDILPPIETGEPLEDPEITPAQELEEEPAVQGWWSLIAAAFLFIAGLLVHRWRRARTPGPAGSGETAETDAPMDMPPEAAEEEASWSPPPLDHRLTLRGTFADGRAFEASCDISAEAINVLIGRGDADLRIDSAAVSRQHACLNGSSGSLTIADLGSNNGTSINGVPCLEDEVMYVEPGDTVILGDARFTIEIEAVQED